MFIVDRVRELCKRNGIKITFLESKMGVYQGYFSNVAKGKVSIPENRIEWIAHYFNISPEYLKGETENANPRRIQYEKIKVLSNVAGGIPLDAIDTFDADDPDSWEEIERAIVRGGEYFGLRIHGNSMLPRIMDGDIVIVRKQEEVEDGQIAIVTIDGERGTCKKVKYRPDGIMLVSTNPDVEPLFYTKKQVETLPVRIVGRVIKVHGDV